MNRFTFGTTLVAAALAFVTPAGLRAQTAAYPSKPITIVVPVTAGSTTDGLARAIAQEITARTGQSVVVDNKAGANGAIAAQAAARSAPDGYTVFMTTNTSQAANPHLFKKLPYDPVKDFTPVSALVRGYLLMVTNPNVPAGNVAELIAYAKKNPGKLSFGAGTSSARVAVELFKQMSSTDIVHVPYKANPQAVTDLVGGQVDLMIVDLTTSLPHVKSGKLTAMGVSSPKRSSLVPELPTIAESGLPGYEMSFWNAAYVPAGTPEPVVKRLNELLHQAIATEAVRKFIAANGMEPFVSTPAEMAAFQNAEIERWGRVIRAAGIEPE